MSTEYSDKWRNFVKVGTGKNYYSLWDSISNWTISFSHVAQLNGTTQQVAHMLLYRVAVYVFSFTANGPSFIDHT